MNMTLTFKPCSSFLTSSLKLLVFTRLWLCCLFFLDFAVFVLDVLARLFRSLTFKPSSFLLTSSLKTKLLVFPACFSSWTPLLMMSAELQSLLSLLSFCLTCKSLITLLLEMQLALAIVRFCCFLVLFIQIAKRPESALTSEKPARMRGGGGGSMSFKKIRDGVVISTLAADIFIGKEEKARCGNADRTQLV